MNNTFRNSAPHPVPSRGCILLLMGFTLTLALATIAADSVTLSFAPTGAAVETFVLELPDGTLEKTVEAFAETYDYRATVAGPNGPIPNPMTKAQFMGRQIRRYCIEVTRGVEVHRAQQKATNTVNKSLDDLESKIKVK